MCPMTANERQTAIFNGLDPEAYLHDVLARIANHPINKIYDLLTY